MTPDSDGPDDADVPSAEFVVTHRPVSGEVTSPFGDRVHPIFGTVRAHKGLDLDGDTGDPIMAAADGVVLVSGWRNGYGNTVVISHGGGYTTLYAHQNEVNVAAGDRVARWRVDRLGRQYRLVDRFPPALRGATRRRCPRSGPDLLGRSKTAENVTESHARVDLDRA